ncbi:MAG: magnesium-translocating P-type ATPase [Candidatus Bathyarchaeia archaeon]|jgi:Mg2+-importing ATPase
MAVVSSDKKKDLQEPVGWAQTASPEDILCVPIDDVLARLKTSRSGLASDQALESLKTYGYNEVAKKKRTTAVVKFLSGFKNPLVLILLFAAVISAITELESAVIIVAIIMISVVLMFFQESKAEKAAESLKEKVATTATVLRDNAVEEIKLSDVVPGDIVNLSAGDIIPADARLLSAKDFFVDQSALTGESFPIEKIPSQLSAHQACSVNEWNNYLFMGTSVVSGSATAVVVKTGGFTDYGKIVKKLVERRPETEFERGLRRFGYLIMQVTFLLVVFVFLVNALYVRGVVESLLFAVALAVGLTPELLPIILSVNLSKGALAMSKRGVIVKELASIQNFGNMDVLCTDKTGTLTENRVRLLLHVDMEGNDNTKVLKYVFLNSHYETGLKNPLDGAILEHEEVNVEGYEKIDEVPFDFVRRRVSVVAEWQRERFFITKGAPEEIFKVCAYYELSEKIFDLTPETERRIEQKYYDLSAEGYRVLGVAYKKVREEKTVYSINDEGEMVFLGFVAFLDPPKETAKQSLELFKKSNIELKILTGDNELVTRRVCEQLEFEIKGVVLGVDIAKMNDDALARVVEGANIFARVTPSQKDRIINALKSNGHVVGFLGDGINDAPSMRVSDVSISVENAVDVAKESADIILLHKDLTVLEEGVLEGRKTFGNTMKYIEMGVSSNFGNMFSAAGASLFLHAFLPMQSTQILLNNLMYDMSELSIPTDNVDPDYVEKPRRLQVSYIRNFMLYFGPISSLFDFLTFFIMLYVFTAGPAGHLFQTAWFIESLCTQTLVIFVIRTRKSPFFKSRPSKLLVISSLAVVGFAILIPFTPLGGVFQFVPPPPGFFLFLAAFVAVYLTMAESMKRVFYKRYGQSLEQILVPAKGPPLLTPTVRLTQNMVAVICLRREDETSIDSLVDDLKSIMAYPVEPDQVTRNLHHMRRMGLVDVDWRKGIIKRKTSMKDYVDKLIRGDLWPRVADDWQRIGSLVQSKYKQVNPEYQRLLQSWSVKQDRQVS